jgi:hypothetical protein
MNAARTATATAVIQGQARRDCLFVGGGDED